jgi:hypothetical protein
MACAMRGDRPSHRVVLADSPFLPSSDVDLLLQASGSACAVNPLRGSSTALRACG